MLFIVFLVFSLFVRLVSSSFFLNFFLACSCCVVTSTCVVILFSARDYSLVVVPHSWLLPTSCSQHVAILYLLFFTRCSFSFVVFCLPLSLVCCSLHLILLHLLFPACCFSLLVAPHLLFFLAYCCPFITPLRLLLPTCRSSPLATPCLCFPRWYSLPLFVFASSLWNHKQQVKTKKQSEFLFFLIPFLFDHF